MNEAIIIIVLACNNLMTNPATGKQVVCQEFPLTFLEQMTSLQCLMGAQAQVARTWWPTHQNWQIRKITCQPRQKLAKRKADI